MSKVDIADKRKCLRVANQLMIWFLAGEFGHRKSGRFRISRKNLRRILGMHNIYPEIFAEIKDVLWRDGYAFINEDEFFAVAERKTLVRWRLVPTYLVNEAMKPDFEPPKEKVKLKKEDERPPSEDPPTFIDLKN